MDSQQKTTTNNPPTSPSPSPSQSSTHQDQDPRLLRLYGRAVSALPSPTRRFAHYLKERKYFDSGDYALSKAGRGDGVDVGVVGSLHPAPRDIPHPCPCPRLGSGMGMGMGVRKSSCLSVSP